MTVILKEGSKMKHPHSKRKSKLIKRFLKGALNRL